MKLQELINKCINELEGSASIKKHYSKYLYHSTNIKNLNTIKSYGLLPEFGDTIKQAYGGYYKFGDEEDVEDDDYDQPAELDFDGILFFSEKPLIGFSQTMQQNFKWDEVLLCVIEKNDTIFHKISDYPKFTDFQGNVVSSINYISTNQLPIFIETDDWFSFDEQECKYLLYGENLKRFIQINFPDIYNRYITEIKESSTINESTYKVYHGTNQKFNKFSLNKATQGIVWFTDSIESINKGEHGGQGNNYILTRYITLNNPAGWEEYEKYELGQLRSQGYDGVILPDDDKTDYIVFSTKNISAKPLNEEDYRGEHSAPTNNNSTAPLYNLSQNFPEDLYSKDAVRLYGNNDPNDRLTMNIIQSARNKPNKQISIYRAVPKIITNTEKINDYIKQQAYIMKFGKLPKGVNNWSNRSEYYEWLSKEIEKLTNIPDTDNANVKINSGDWVTINPQYAKEHGINNLNNKFRIIRKTVPAKSLFWDGGDINEWGYNS